MKFELNDAQLEKLDSWKREQNKKAVEKQKAEPPDIDERLLQEMWNTGFPYTGAIGGDLEFIFTPTSIGVIAVVKHVMTGEELDLTDYNLW